MPIASQSIVEIERMWVEGAASLLEKFAKLAEEMPELGYNQHYIDNHAQVLRAYLKES